MCDDVENDTSIKTTKVAINVHIKNLRNLEFFFFLSGIVFPLYCVKTGYKYTRAGDDNQWWGNNR